MLTAPQLVERSCADLVQEEATDFRVHALVYTDPLLYERVDERRAPAHLRPGHRPAHLPGSP